MQFYKRFLLILLSAALLAASFIDGLAFVAWFCLIPFFIVIAVSNIRSTVFLSWTTGILFFAGVTYWFVEYSYAFWFPIIGVLSIFFIFYGIVFRLVYKYIKWPHLRILMISAIWVAVEFFRHRTFLAFPWGILGYSQHSYLQVMQISKLTGVMGVSLLIVLFNLCIAEIILYFLRQKNNQPQIKIRTKKFIKGPVFLTCVLIAFIVIANAISGYIYMISSEDNYKYERNKLNVVLVQPNISFDDKFETDTGVLIPDRTGASGKYFREGTELVVFPESVVWGTLERERNDTFFNWVRKTAKDEKLYFIMGQILWDEYENYYNAVQLYNPELEVLGRYNKIHPLPCAEYMPYPDVLGFLSFMNIAKLNITPARQYILINYPGKGSIGANICFESTLQIISRTYRKTGANVLFTFTDTAGFRGSIVALHHLIFSKVRAIENGSFMVHSGNNGISAIIDPSGRILTKTDLVKKEVLYGSIYFNNKVSFYTRYGELLLYMYFGIVFLSMLFYFYKQLK